MRRPLFWSELTAFLIDNLSRDARNLLFIAAGLFFILVAGLSGLPNHIDELTFDRVSARHEVCSICAGQQKFLSSVILLTVVPNNEQSVLSNERCKLKLPRAGKIFQSWDDLRPRSSRRMPIHPRRVHSLSVPPAHSTRGQPLVVRVGPLCPRCCLTTLGTRATSCHLRHPPVHPARYPVFLFPRHPRLHPPRRSQRRPRACHQTRLSSRPRYQHPRHERRRPARTIHSLKAGGVAILLSEQNLPFAAGVADRAYVLEKGEMRWSGTMAALRADEAIRRAYLEV